MSSRLIKAAKDGLISPPKWMIGNMAYEVQMGSTAYGVSDDKSDMDIYGFCVPPKRMIFPHVAGFVPGFGTPPEKFENYQQHHVEDKSDRKEYDFSIYSIVKFFDLVMSNNPNMVDALFVPQRCVLFCSEIGQMVRDNRHTFLHKGSYHKFRGYAYSNLHKLENKKVRPIPKHVAEILDRVDRIKLTKLDHEMKERKSCRTAHFAMLDMAELQILVDYRERCSKREWDAITFGFDVKHGYHVARLALECRQILEEHTLDITKSRELLKGIRRGEWTFERLKDWFGEEEKRLDELYHKSTLRHSPDEATIKELLLSCLEQHYGSIDDMVKRDTKIDDVLRDMQNVLHKYGVV
jgi:uncharacterized protein